MNASSDWPSYVKPSPLTQLGSDALSTLLSIWRQGSLWETLPTDQTKLAYARLKGLACSLKEGLRAFPNDSASHQTQLLLDLLRRLLRSTAADKSPSSLGLTQSQSSACNESAPPSTDPGSSAEATASSIPSSSTTHPCATGDSSSLDSAGLASGPAFTPPPQPQPTTLGRSTPIVPAFQRLLETWQQTPDWKMWIQILPPCPEEQLPAALWLLTHRLPPETALKWQQQWHETAGSNGVSTRLPTKIAGPFEILLRPELPDGTPAVRMCPDAGIDPVLSPLDTDWPLLIEMARSCSVALWWIEHDPALQHAWQFISLRGIHAFNDSSRQRYRDALISRFESFQKAVEQNNTVDIIMTWLDLDEAIHSLIYDPYPHSESSFMRIINHTRNMLKYLYELSSNNGMRLYLHAPSGEYYNARSYIDLGKDVELQRNGEPGTIIHCLRMYCKLNGNQSLARLCYRSIMQ